MGSYAGCNIPPPLDKVDPRGLGSGGAVEDVEGGEVVVVAAVGMAKGLKSLRGVEFSRRSE